jgi:hypothetical protein
VTRYQGIVLLLMLLCVLAVIWEGRRRARQERGRKVAQDLADVLMRPPRGPIYRA